MAACLSEDLLLAFLERRLLGEERALASEHLSACSECRSLVADAAPAFADTTATRLTPTKASAVDEAAVLHQRSSRKLVPGSPVARYVIRERIGSGGMGIVYLAHDPQLGRDVALKLVRHVRAEAGRAVVSQRLLREARAMARVTHPNVVTVYDAGEVDGQVFIAMELVTGPTLAQWLRSETRDWRAVMRVFLDAGEGLRAAHAVGLVHRDFKPQNVLIGADGRVRVTDFGLARPDALGPSHDNDSLTSVRCADPILSATLTGTGAMVGTPGYMAPEQFAGADTDARTDQFSFCAALYEGFYGVRPFEGDEFSDLAFHVLNGTLRSIPERSEVPAAIGEILVRGLQVERDARYPSLAALLSDLERILHAPPPGAAPKPAAPSSTSRRWSGARVLAVSSPIVAAAVVAAFLLVGRTRASSAPHVAAALPSEEAKPNPAPSGSFATEMPSSSASVIAATSTSARVQARPRVPANDASKRRSVPQESRGPDGSSTRARSDGLKPF